MLQLAQLKSLKVKGQHAAFTDLCSFKQYVYCCFRVASDHISGDGELCIVRISAKGDVVGQTRLRNPAADLRDPKLSVTSDGKLLLLAYARYRDESGKTLFGQSQTWFSGDGFSWSSAKAIGEKNWWLWRLRWHGTNAYGFAYNRGQQRLQFWGGNPRRTFECLNPNALSLATHGLGYPNESDLFFRGNRAYSLVRRDADTGTAQLGTAIYPFKHWRWQSLKTYLGGPIMLDTGDKVWVAGRGWTAKGPVTYLADLDLLNAKLQSHLILPSSGDCSYPGLVKTPEGLLMSYYSSHEGQTQVYLADIRENQTS